MLESGGRETEKRHQRDVRDGSINPSRSVVAARERLNGVFRGSLGAYSPRACSQVSGRSDILLVVGGGKLGFNSTPRASTPLMTGQLCFLVFPVRAVLN